MSRNRALWAVFALLPCFVDCSPRKYHGSGVVNDTGEKTEPVFQRLRWTKSQIKFESLSAILAVIRSQKGVVISDSNFSLLEDRMLSNMRFRMFVQSDPADKTPITGASIRVWERPNGELIQLEADVLDEPSLAVAKKSLGLTNSQALERRALSLVVDERDGNQSIQQTSTSFDVHGGKLLMRLKVRVEQGIHTYWFQASDGAPVDHIYRTFTQESLPQQPDLSDEYSLDAMVFPITDAGNTREFRDNGVRGELEPIKLRHIKKTVPQRSPVHYFPIESRTFLTEEMLPSAQVLSDEQVAGGMWNYGAVRERLKKLSQSDSRVSNQIGLNNPVRLVGRFASVYWHPDAAKSFGFPVDQVRLAPEHTSRDGTRGTWFVPFHYGIPFYTARDGMTRASSVSPVELKQPQDLMRQGFDEMQTYNMVTTFFESMQGFGFSDPQLSTDPVDVILYNPGVTDNAFSNLSGEINFGIYKGVPSMARNNATGWHELGHEIIARLAHAELGGDAAFAMHEGVADFVANSIVRTMDHKTLKPWLVDPRPYNSTLFHLNNEVHAAGEAFGGTLVEMADKADAQFGKAEGIKRVTDLLFETLRLIRGTSNLTEENWYEHMLYADSLERPSVVPSRKPGEMTAIIKEVFGKRNVLVEASDKLAHFDVAVKTRDKEFHTIEAKDNVFSIKVATDGKAPQTLMVKMGVQDGSRAKFSYPVTMTLLIRGRKGANVPVGAEKMQAFEHNIVLNGPSENVEIPVELAAKCPENIPAIYREAKKVRVCKSLFQVTLVDKVVNTERPANHQKMGMVVMTEYL
jgi:hypothetical protein